MILKDGSHFLELLLFMEQSVYLGIAFKVLIVISVPIIAINYLQVCADGFHVT